MERPGSQASYPLNRHGNRKKSGPLEKEEYMCLTSATPGSDREYGINLNTYIVSIRPMHGSGVIVLRTVKYAGLLLLSEAVILVPEYVKIPIGHYSWLCPFDRKRRMGKAYQVTRTCRASFPLHQTTCLSSPRMHNWKTIGCGYWLYCCIWSSSQHHPFQSGVEEGNEVQVECCMDC